MTVWLQFTAGRGPAACSWVVAQAISTLKREANQLHLDCHLLHAVSGPQPNSFLSSLVSLDGDKCHEFAASWVGTLQWIGCSPYRPHHKRKNWFIGITLFQPPKQSAFALKDLHFEHLKASGPGGQHVNKSSTAVRITHIPSGLQVKAQEERSQKRNRALALARIQALLLAQQQNQQAQQQQKRWAAHNQLVRGNPVRIYRGEHFKRHR